MAVEPVPKPEPLSRKEEFAQNRSLFRVSSRDLQQAVHDYMYEVGDTIDNILLIEDGIKGFLKEICDFTGHNMGAYDSFRTNFRIGRLGKRKTQALLFYLCCKHNGFYCRHPRYEKDDPHALGLWQLIPGAPQQIQFGDPPDAVPDLPPLSVSDDPTNERDGLSVDLEPKEEPVSEDPAEPSTQVLERGFWPDFTGQQRPSNPSNPQPRLHYPEIQRHEPSGEKSTPSWLSPLVANTLKFVGRDRQMATLNAFAEADGPFLVWAISGPSGAGKTRLITEWMRGLKRQAAPGTLNIGFLTADMLRQWKDDHQGEWKTWEPDRQTIIVIDYLHLFTDDIRALFERGFALLAMKGGIRRPPVRLLLIDHIFPENYHDLFKDWRFARFSGRGAMNETKQDIFWQDAPLYLRQQEQPTRALARIMQNAAEVYGVTMPSRTIGHALRELRGIEGAWSPLFAALRGRALALQPSAQFGDRRDLIRLYLDTDNRLPWNAADPQQASYGLWAGYWVAAATAVHGISFKALRAWLSQQVPMSRDAIDRIVTLSHWIVSDTDPFTLAPFRPDLVGETFFLLFLKRIQHDPLHDVLIVLISQVIKENQLQAPRDFLDFLFRLIDGLAQEPWEWSQLYIELLLNFLSEDIVNTDEIFCQISTICIARVYLVLSEFFSDDLKENSNKVHDLLNFCNKKINLYYFLVACRADFGFSPIILLIKYYEQKESEGRLTEKLRRVVLDALQYTSEEVSKTTKSYINPLFLASFAKKTALFDLVLADSKTNVNEVFENNFTVLLLLVWERKIQFVDRLLKHPDIDVNKMLVNGATALYIACEMGDEYMVSAILRTDKVDQNLFTSFGFTPLDIAIVRCNNVIVNILIDNPKTNLNYQDKKGISPLSRAIIMDNEEVAIKLILEQRLEINVGIHNTDLTALHFACNKGNPKIVQAFLNRCDIEANRPATDEQATPLMVACEAAHKEIVRLMVSHEFVNIDAVDAYGRTAMDHALIEGYVDIIDILREYGGKSGSEFL